MSSLSQSTILLTIYNRYNFTKRWLDYAKEKNFKINIFICDGGKDGEFNKIIDLNTYKSLNLKYYKSKYTKDFGLMFNKFYEAVKQIKTNFIYLAEDDDFIIEKNIFKSERFLIKNKDYSSSGGLNVNLEYLLINKKKGKIFIRLPEKNLNILRNKPVERLLDGLKFVNSNYNTLHRRESLEKILFFLKNKKYQNLYITELVIYLYSLFNGKCKRFNHLEYLKFDNIKHSASKNFSRDFLNKIVLNKSFSQENYYFLNFLNKKIIKDKNFDKFKKSYFLLLEADLKFRLKKNNKLETFIRNKIKNSFVEKFVKLIYRYYKFYNLKDYDIYYDKRNSKSLLLNDIKDISQIYEFLNDYKKF
ncbi:TIGR00180 family glycosyltransferase [Candidatus Pelagibacter bacterium nBUS_25]|uniref:TIGR00180 family glycosyltransferase n=1 Tax=Candidatus Pelagibacter bacterium nBUS_25 TaxID=3374187 RepID=UPI003EB78FDF